MAPHARGLQWTICESEYEWHEARSGQSRFGADSIPGRPGARRRNAWWQRGSVPLLLVVVLVVCLWTWQSGRRRLARHHAELQTTLRLEQWAVANDNPAAARLALDPDARAYSTTYDAEFKRLAGDFWNGARDPPVSATVEVVDECGDVAAADVHFTLDSGTTYRQTRFYRRTEQGWLRTAPDPLLWGLPRTLETDRLIFHCRQRDLPVVTAVAERADVLAATVERTFGLPVSGPDKVSVTVRVDTRPYTVALDGKSVRLASPAVALAPMDVSDADLLAQALALALVQRAVSRTARSTLAISDWRPLVNAVGLWQLWNLELPLALWQEPVTSWVFAGGYATEKWPMRVRPDGFTVSRICRAHSIWAKPETLHIPVTCSPSTPTVSPSSELTPWDVPLSPYSLTSDIGRYPHPGRVVALTTLVDYLAVTYGAGTFPALIAALGQQPTWHTLVPAVYGIPLAELRAGWCEHLHTTYGIVCPDD